MVDWKRRWTVQETIGQVFQYFLQEEGNSRVSTARLVHSLCKVVGVLINWHAVQREWEGDLERRWEERVYALSDERLECTELQRSRKALLHDQIYLLVATSFRRNGKEDKKILSWRVAGLMQIFGKDGVFPKQYADAECCKIIENGEKLTKTLNFILSTSINFIGYCSIDQWAMDFLQHSFVSLASIDRIWIGGKEELPEWWSRREYPEYALAQLRERLVPCIEPARLATENWYFYLHWKNFFQPPYLSCSDSHRIVQSLCNNRWYHGDSLNSYWFWLKTTSGKCKRTSLHPWWNSIREALIDGIVIHQLGYHWRPVWNSSTYLVLRKQKTRINLVLVEVLWQSWQSKWDRFDWAILRWHPEWSLISELKKI